MLILKASTYVFGLDLTIFHLSSDQMVFHLLSDHWHNYHSITSVSQMFDQKTTSRKLWSQCQCKGQEFLLAGYQTLSWTNSKEFKTLLLAFWQKSLKFSHITPIFKELHWLPVEKRIQYKILLLTVQCLNILAPDYLKELPETYHPPRPLRSASTLSLKVATTRLKT